MALFFFYFYVLQISIVNFAMKPTLTRSTGQIVYVSVTAKCAALHCRPQEVTVKVSQTDKQHRLV